jgi:hypothetical protein
MIYLGIARLIYIVTQISFWQISIFAIAVVFAVVLVWMFRDTISAQCTRYLWIFLDFILARPTQGDLHEYELLQPDGRIP